jgi:hypothetical protein
MTPKKLPRRTRRKLDLELQRAHQSIAEHRIEAERMHRHAKAISEATHNRAVTNMKPSA